MTFCALEFKMFEIQLFEGYSPLLKSQDAVVNLSPIDLDQDQKLRNITVLQA